MNRGELWLTYRTLLNFILTFWVRLSWSAILSGYSVQCWSGKHFRIILLHLIHIFSDLYFCFILGFWIWSCFDLIYIRISQIPTAMHIIFQCPKETWTIPPSRGINVVHSTVLRESVMHSHTLIKTHACPFLRLTPCLLVNGLKNL